MAERDIQAEFLLAASEAGHRLYRNNVGVAKHVAKAKSFVHYGVGGNGAPDTMGWTRKLLFAAVELKRPGKEPELDQAKWLRMALRQGHRHVWWADNVAAAMAILDAGLDDAAVAAGLLYLEARIDQLKK